MIPLNLWELPAPIKALYADCMEPVCHTYHITRMELDILLFLANNPKYDTAAEIIEIRYLAKSHVSIQFAFFTRICHRPSTGRRLPFNYLYHS